MEGQESESTSSESQSGTSSDEYIEFKEPADIIVISDNEAASARNGDGTSCDPLPVGGTSCDLLPEEKEDTHAYLRVWKNAAFVIDLGDQDPMMMIRNLESDNNGAYTCMGTRTSTWKTEESIDDFERARCAKNTENRFIRYISAYPDPELLLLGYDSQFRDLDRFCTSPVNFSILSIDPTFNLGAFYVTPMSYENLFLVSNRTKKHPTFLGPVLISHNLDESCYSHLTIVTTQKSPLLEDNLIAFGTDGEKALYNQFGKKFKSAVHVCCIGHFRENCKTHLKGVSLENQNKILNDIFGKNIEDMHTMVV
ncbi:Hypothetical predicted protein [Paramuricea clavata]|uniref:Uncharacterized protein n=1 Tax=Paramuricea clavata TaxID=317549 RepID=A0A7D9I644_PARCT|nr:Hypothetical predicted protein [Paramuricea clavata]